MSKIISIIIGIAAIGGIAVILTSGGSNTDSQESPDTGAPMEKEVMEEKAMDDESFVGTIGNLLKSRKNLTCTFARSDENGEISGVVYVTTDDRMRGDFTMLMPQFGEINGHVIQKDGYGYTWGLPMMQGGVKVKLDEDGNPVQKDDNGMDMHDEEFDYNCEPWKVASSKFALPSDVEFQDISAQVEKIDEAMNTMQDMKCDACNQVPAGPARDQCLQAMGC